MKLFSRKSLVAGATAIAVSFAGVNVATAEENPEVTGVEAGAGAGNNEDQTGGDNDNNDDESGSSIGDLSSSEDKDVDPDEIKAWIGVVSAVIGVLGSIFAFVNKYIDIPGLK
ncbi:hypothetical protein [Corynebacterium sp. HMSC04H06]|uniref:hypothetical protein n=1 Tax=Corynebacterium sp. HMSC04H06 TaxID=1581050 RepID=UPI0008A571DE|nr:hypothetical protein [Corynebacterium sp. HMSC04H06]OFS22540.1 hypothetical protein HMPREF3067_03395 [Corynebacterium sp. HMSC04H06]